MKKPRAKPKKVSWSKLMMVVIIGVCIEIIIYSEIAMWYRYDLSALYALIGVPAAMFGTFWTYCDKSKAENTQGGITYDMAMHNLKTDDGTPPVEPQEGDGGGVG